MEKLTTFTAKYSKVNWGWGGGITGRMVVTFSVQQALSQIHKTFLIIQYLITFFFLRIIKFFGQSCLVTFFLPLLTYSDDNV